MLAALPWRHIAVRTSIATAAVCSLLIGLLSVPAEAQTTGPDPEPCAAPVPTADIEVGMTGTGLTVTTGTEPEAFGAEVLGTLEDGIWPGVDLIIADLDSPAVDANGVWAGMSGSPVYADDGRLLGAVSYSLSSGPSTIAGLTPAEDMHELLTYPAATAARAAGEVQLPATVRQRAVAASDATAAEVRQGMAPLPVPLAVSGLRRGRFGELQRRLGSNVDVRPYAAGGAGTQAGAVDDIFPGSNFAAAQSYGALSFTGIGTTTAVCDGAALAFGHPFLWSGRSTLSAHGAEAILIQPDPAWSSFKVANPTGVVGAVDQDRLAGLRAALGAQPDVTPVRSTIRSRDLDRETTLRTWVTDDENVPALASFHTELHINEALDSISGGRMQLEWTARGTTRNGRRWSLTRRNAFVGRGDVSIDATAELYRWLDILRRSRSTTVDFTRVTASGVGDQAFRRYRLGAVRVAVGSGRFRTVGAIERLRVRPGTLLRVEAPLVPDGRSTASRTVSLRLRVPRSLRGRTATLGVFGGQSVVGERRPQRGTSFADTLSRMRREESNNDVLARLQRGGGAAGPKVSRKAEKTLRDVVRGRRTVRVEVR